MDRFSTNRPDLWRLAPLKCYFPHRSWLRWEIKQPFPCLVIYWSAVFHGWPSLLSTRNLFFPQIFIDRAWKEVINALRGAFSAVEHLNSSQAAAANGLDRVHTNQTTKVVRDVSISCSPPPGALMCQRRRINSFYCLLKYQFIDISENEPQEG